MSKCCKELNWKIIEGDKMSKKIVKMKRIYCRFCGAKLKRDEVGMYCPTKNCQWSHGLPEDEDYGGSMSKGIVSKRVKRSKNDSDN